MARDRIEALEKRLHHLEDKVSEILRRGAGVGTLVSTSFGQTHGEQFPPDRDGAGGAEQASDDVHAPVGGGESVKPNA